MNRARSYCPYRAREEGVCGREVRLRFSPPPPRSTVLSKWVRCCERLCRNLYSGLPFISRQGQVIFITTLPEHIQSGACSCDSLRARPLARSPARHAVATLDSTGLYPEVRHASTLAPHTRVLVFVSFHLVGSYRHAIALVGYTWC